MTILCAGINHHIAPVDVRERFAVANHEIADVLHNVRRIEGLHEAVIVSTCNRVEFYAASICPELTLDGLRDYLEMRTGLEAPLYHHDTPSSVRHLFRVASGLDSMVLGETEILGQVKQAYATAAGAGATSGTLNRLFQNAFRVAKSVRTETQITRGATSVGSVAVELAGKIFGDLDHRRVMVLGAGETSERVARSLVSRGVKTVIVSNRTFDRAAQLAGEIGGMAIHFDHWQNEFPDVDILISSTAAPHPLVTRERLEPMMRQRSGRPLFIIDLAVPRDVEPAVNRLDGVFLYDIDSLRDIAHRSLAVRQSEIEHCERIIDRNVTDFVGWLRRRQHAVL
ncbi:MAG TPA: glutamyl-tRNA reductase [Chthoniobacterales bacterium]|nr:glutamyl-tRNA reductase [Chthoniobacterales bacterium]